MSIRPKTKRVRKWRRRFAWAGAAGCLLLVVGWFVLTSQSFLKGVVLPWVGGVIHAELTAESVKLHRLSSLVAREVRLTPRSGEQLIEAKELEVHYRLPDLLDGIIALDIVRIVEPRVTIQGSGAEKNNLSGWLGDFEDGPDDGGEAQDKNTPLQFAVGSVEIVGGQLDYLERISLGRGLHVFANELGFTMDQFRNGQSSKAEIVMNLLVETTKDGSVTNDFLAAKLNADTTIEFAENLFPKGLEVSVGGSMTRALGRFRESVGLETTLTIASSASKVRSAVIDFSRDGKGVGKIAAVGELEIETGIGEFDLEIHRLPPIVLELASLKTGWNFDLVSFDSTNHVVLAGGGAPIESSGYASIEKLIATDEDEKVPEVDVLLAYDVQLERRNSRGVFRELRLSMDTIESGKAAASITKPFGFAWNGSSESTAGSELELRLEQVRLGDWRALTGQLPADGILNLDAKVQSLNGGLELVLKGGGLLMNGTVNLGTNRLDKITADLVFEGKLDELNSLSIGSAALNLSNADRAPVTVDCSGSIKFDGAETDLRTRVVLPASYAALWGADLPDEFIDESVSFDGGIRFADAAWAIAGNLTSSEFDYVVGPKFLMAVRVDLPVVLNIDEKAIDWQIKDASLVDSAGELLSISTAGKIELADGSSQFSLSAPDIRTALINGYVTNYTEDLKLSSGQMSVDIQGGISPTGEQSWSATVASTNLVFVDTNGIPVTDVLGDSAILEIVLNPLKTEIELVRFDGDLYSGGEPCGTLRGSGKIQLDGRQAEVEITVADLDENALRPVVPLLIGDQVMENVDIDGKLELNYRADTPSKLSAAIDVNDLLVRDSSASQSFQRQSIRLAFDSKINRRRIDVSNAELVLAETDKASNKVELAGWLNFDNPSAIEGDITLSSAGFDITPIYDLLSKPSVVDAPTTERTDAKFKIAELKSAEEASNLPIERVEISTDFRELFFRELVATNWVTKSVIRSNTLEIPLFSLSLNGAPVNVSASLISNPDNFTYSVAAEIERVRLFPLIRTFYPEWRGLAMADIYGAVDLDGRVDRDSSLWSEAQGNLFFGVTNAHAELMSARWQDILRPVGLLLQTPELFSSPVNWFYSHTELGGEELRLHQYTVMADAYIADLSARIALNEDFVSSPIPNVPVHLYLTRNLLTQSHITQEEGESSTYVLLPNFLYLQGTFEEPKAEIDKLKTSGMVLGKAGDFVGGTAGDVVKGAGELSASIGGVLSGRKLVGTNTNLGPVSHGIDFVFRSIGGIFGGAGKAVDEGTEVVTGTEVVKHENLEGRFHSFDWPRRFTNAPNSIATMSD